MGLLTLQPADFSEHQASTWRQLQALVRGVSDGDCEDIKNKKSSLRCIFAYPVREQYLIHLRSLNISGVPNGMSGGLVLGLRGREGLRITSQPTILIPRSTWHQHKLGTNLCSAPIPNWMVLKIGNPDRLGTGYWALAKVSKIPRMALSASSGYDSCLW